jgi:hypothetical protein
MLCRLRRQRTLVTIHRTNLLRCKDTKIDYCFAEKAFQCTCSICMKASTGIAKKARLVEDAAQQAQKARLVEDTAQQAK